MKKNCFLLLFLFCNIYALTSQNNEWVKVKDTISAYIIEFPLEPKKESQDVPTDKGPLKMDSYMLQAYDDDNLVYMTSFSKYPKSFFENGLNTIETQNGVLNNSIKGAVTNTKGKLISVENISFNGYPGRDFKIQIDSGGIVYIMHIRNFLVGYTLYLTQVIYEKANEGNASEKRFFESFELINVTQ